MLLYKTGAEFAPLFLGQAQTEDGIGAGDGQTCGKNDHRGHGDDLMFFAKEDCGDRRA